MEILDFRQIYEKYSSKIALYLCRFVGRDEAEDLMQEVFIKVNSSLSTFKGESQLSTWIYKIATNCAIDRLRSSEYRKGISKTTSLNYIEDLKTAGQHRNLEDTDIEYNFLKTEMNQCIADYINKLQDNYKAIFLLKEYENLAIEEIAEITGISVENVKIRLHRGRKKLHEMLLKNCSFYYDEYSKLCCDKK